MAATVNTFISIMKGIAYVLTGNVAMFAETLHSIGDAANQFFVFIGSALSKKAPTERFPNGFGRLVNLVLLGAVLIVGIMSYETIKEGIHHILHPVASGGFLISVVVLSIAVLLESIVLYKAMKEVIHETGTEAKGFAVVTESIKNLKKAKPATKLVLLEDAVATGGGLLALIAVILAHYTPFYAAEGIASILIGLMMFLVVGKVFFDNAAGVLGEADEAMEQTLGNLLMNDPDVNDVKNMVVLKEGEALHVEVVIEVLPNLTVKEAGVIKTRIKNKLLAVNGVVDVVVEVDEHDNVDTWKNEA